jgi:hypothetical protein
MMSSWRIPDRKNKMVNWSRNALPAEDFVKECGNIFIKELARISKFLQLGFAGNFDLIEIKINIIK